MTLKLHVLRVFCDPQGRAGNPLGVFLHASELGAHQRQEVAAELGFSETVFFQDLAAARLHIHTPTTEIALAGHPLVGAGWLLAKTGVEMKTLRPKAGPVAFWQDAELTWIAADPKTGPAFELHQLKGPGEVDALPGVPGGGGLVMAWAWADEREGRVRARVFASALGVDEDPATGSAALRLAAFHGRALTIVQGGGSHIHARPRADGLVEVGGRVALDSVRDFAF